MKKQNKVFDDLDNALADYNNGNMSSWDVVAVAEKANKTLRKNQHIDEKDEITLKDVAFICGFISGLFTALGFFLVYFLLNK